MAIDHIDREILRILSGDGRISNVELASRINLSASACLRRVQEMEKAGIIAGYRAVLDPSKLGNGFVAYVAIGLSTHTIESQRIFERAVEAASQVRECHNVAGAVEYLLRVEVPDIEAYKHFHSEVLGSLPQVSMITTYVVMDAVKDERR